MEAFVCRVEKVSTTKHRQFQMRLNGAWQGATTWSDADHQKAIERLVRKIHQVTAARCTLFDKLFQHHECQLLQEVGTKTTGPRSIFAKELAVMKAAAEEEAYGAANMSADKRLQFHTHRSIAETEASTWNLSDTECVTNQLEREICGITSNEQKSSKKELSIHLILVEACWETIWIQALRNTIEQWEIHFRYPKMHLVSHISESIQRMGLGANFTTDVSEWLHIANL